MTHEHAMAFLRVLDPLDNSTGGGTASAIAGSMAAALTAMVARLSIDGAGGEPDSYYGPIADQGAVLAESLRAGGDEDARAFDGVMAAYRLPKDTEDDMAARSSAIRAAMVTATLTPLENAEKCALVRVLVSRLEGRANPRALSDLQSAAFLAEASLRGCLANVDLNLPGVKDNAAVADIRARAATLRATLSPNHP